MVVDTAQNHEKDPWGRVREEIAGLTFSEFCDFAQMLLAMANGTRDPMDFYHELAQWSEGPDKD